MSHRQGLHSDDSPYPGEPLCYCDEDKPSTPSNTSFKEELEQILKGYHDRLLMTETAYDIKQRNTALTSIINLVDKELPKHKGIETGGWIGYNKAIDDMRAIIRGNDV